MCRRSLSHPNQVSAWKRQLLDAVPEAFARGGKRKLAKEHEAKVHDLHAKIGELTVEFFSARVEALSRAERVRMIEPEGPLSLSRQCVVLGVSRSSLYYRPKGESAENLALMRRMDELHMDPFYGSRQMMRHLRREGVTAGRHRIRRLMAVMGMEATYRRPRTSVANSEHRIFPYLLRDLDISRADHVWCADIPDARIFLPCGRDGLGHPARALLAAVQHDGRLVLHWGPGRLVRASPEILNTDQGSQFTSEAFADRVLGAGVAFSMDAGAGSSTTSSSNGLAVAEVRGRVPA